MKFNLKNGTQLLSLAALTLALCAPLSAQEERRSEGRNTSSSTSQVYVISAKAGGVNYVTGAARVTRDNTGQTQILAKGDELGDKDMVSVGASGRAEILLNPGSFLRLAENTEFEMTNTALESLKLKLASGSALIEASDVGDDGAEISIATPQANIQLEKSGIYRINADANATEIYVWKGSATVGGEVIKSGRKVTVGRNGAVAASVKFDKDEERDALDIWSKDRAKELAKLNDRLERRELERAFRSSAFSGFSSWHRGGFWAYNRFTGAYCFVPFGFDYWDSPYGYGYNRGVFWGYGYRPTIVRPRTIIPASDDTPGFPGQVTRPPSKSGSMPAPAPPSSDNTPVYSPGKVGKGN